MESISEVARIIWGLNQLYLNFNTKTLQHEVKLKEILPPIEHKLSMNLCEMADRDQHLNSIKLDDQSLEERIIAKIIQNIQELDLNEDIPLTEFQEKIIDETRNLLYKFRDIRTSFSSGIIRVLKSVIDRKKINANLAKHDVEKVIEKLEDMVRDKKTQRSTNEKLYSILREDIDNLLIKVKELLCKMDQEYLDKEIVEGEKKLEELIIEKDKKNEKEIKQTEDLLSLDTNYKKTEDKSSVKIIATIRKEMEQYKRRVTSLRRFIALKKRIVEEEEERKVKEEKERQAENQQK